MATSYPPQAGPGHGLNRAGEFIGTESVADAREPAMKPWMLVVLFISRGWGQSQHVSPSLAPAGDTVIQYAFQSVPTWSGGALVAIENNRSASPSVRIFGADGRQIAVTSVRIPGADQVVIRRAARGVGGAVAICGSAADAEGHYGGFLAITSASGEVKVLVRTDLYLPTAVAVSPDGTIWTKGVEYVPVKLTPAKTDDGILRHFDAQGGALGSFVPQSSIEPHELIRGIDQIAANSKRVGWYQGQGTESYVEIQENRVQRYPAIALSSDTSHGAESVSGLTITEENLVFVTKSKGGAGPELYMLDRGSMSWSRVAVPAGGPPSATGWLLGGSGNILVFSTTGDSGLLRRFEAHAR